MMKEETIVASKSPQPDVLDRWPHHLPQPHWLKEGRYNGPYWIVVDDNPRSPKDPRKVRFDLVVSDPRRPHEICRLTDFEYAPLLNVIRLILCKLRTGKYATITSAASHQEASRRLLVLVQWMILNVISRYENLCQADFDAFAENIAFGTGQVLNFHDRILKYISNHKEGGGALPMIKGTCRNARLDYHQILIDAGIDPLIGQQDNFVTFELLKLAEAEGAYLKPQQRARLAAGPPNKERLSSHNIYGALMPWYYLWLLRRELPGDQIGFDPFENESLMEVSEKLGNRAGRTKTAPVRQTMELINCCLLWVLDYAPLLLDLREKYINIFASKLSEYYRQLHMKRVLEEAELPQGPAFLLPLSPRFRRLSTTEFSFGMAVQSFIPAACLVVIAAFTARRHDELLSIRVASPDNDDCLFRDESGLWIETYIEKTDRDWVRTPCNEVVAAAVEILRRWSQPARLALGSIKLFQATKLMSGTAIFFNPNPVLKEFVKILPITPMPDGSIWEFTTHQFRRFFAVMYFWRYHHGDLPSLNYQLRHIDPRVTQLYVTEPDSGAIFRHVNTEFTTTILTEAAMGERNLSGPFGERYKTTVRRLLAHYRKTVRVVSPELVSKTVGRYIEKSGRQLKVFRWGFCACGTSKEQLSTANCLEGENKETRVSPDLSRSGFTTCGNCPHHATEPVFKQFWASEIDETERAAADQTNPPMLRNASSERASELRQYYERSFVHSRPLEVLDGETCRKPASGGSPEAN